MNWFFELPVKEVVPKVMTIRGEDLRRLLKLISTCINITHDSEIIGAEGSKKYVETCSITV